MNAVSHAPAERPAKPPRKRRIYRADKRNARWGRKPRGNTTPVERLAIFHMQAKASVR